MLSGGDYYTKYLVLRYIKLFVLAILASFPVYLLFHTNLTYYQDIIEQLLTPWFDGWNPADLSYVALLRAKPLFSLANINGVLWTMNYIFWGSIISVVLYLMSCNCRNRYGVYALFILIFINMQEIYYVPCVLGALLADSYMAFRERKINIFWGIILLLAGIFLCAYPTGKEPIFPVYSFLPYDYYLYYHIIGAVCLVYLTLYWSPMKHGMEQAVLQFFGKYSMEVYVVHYGILISFSAWLFSILSKHFDYNISSLLVWLATNCVVVIAAYLLSKIVNLIYGKINKAYDRFFGK